METQFKTTEELSNSDDPMTGWAKNFWHCLRCEAQSVELPPLDERNT